MLRKKLTESKSQLHLVSFLKVEMRHAAPDPGRQYQVLQERVPLDAAPSDAPRHALGGISRHPTARLRSIAILDHQRQFFDRDQPSLNLSMSQIANRSHSRYRARTPL